jgi:hypothetical protein
MWELRPRGAHSACGLAHSQRRSLNPADPGIGRPSGHAGSATQITWFGVVSGGHLGNQGAEQ